MTATFGASLADYQGTIPRLLDRAAERDPGGIWLRTDDLQLTFRQAAERVGGAATELADAGIGRGDLIMLTARTTPDYLLSWLAVTALGGADLGSGWDGPLRSVIDVRKLGAGRIFGQALAGLPGGPVRPDDLAVLIPTSGTTGRSKLVMQTHRAYVMAGEGFPYWMELDSSDRLMTSLPLFHINAPIYSALGSLACGAGLVLVPRFSASGFIDSARRHGATEFNAIGAMLEILMRQPERRDDADNPLRLCYAGPAPERERQEQIERRYGIRIVVGYAMSESPYGLIWRHGQRPYGTLGSARQHPYLGTINEVKVVDPDAAGQPLRPRQTGEILLRNPVITPGYWGMHVETAAVLTADGWLHTGDLATVNADGTYTFA